MPQRRLTFDRKETDRIRWCTQALGITYEEFAYHAIMQAVDEVEEVARRTLWQRLMGGSTGTRTRPSTCSDSSEDTTRAGS